MFRCSPSRLLKTIAQSKRLTHSSATLRTSPGGVVQHVWCSFAGEPEFTVKIIQADGCALAGQDLGPKTATVALLFYGGRHLARDKLPQSPCLTLM